MGADYKKAHKSMIMGSSSDQSTPNTTEYICPSGGVFGTAGEMRTYITTSCTLSNLRCHSANAPGAGETYTYTLMLNGAPTALVAQTVNPNTESIDLVNIVAVVPGDSIILRVASSLNAVASVHTFAMEMTH